MPLSINIPFLFSSGFLRTQVVSFAAFVFFFFGLWFVVLFVLKFTSRQNAGCASGRILQKNRRISSKKEAMDQEDRIQAIFLLCGLSVLLSSGLLLSIGLPAVQEAASDISELIAVGHLSYERSSPERS